MTNWGRSWGCSKLDFTYFLNRFYCKRLENPEFPILNDTSGVRFMPAARSLATALTLPGCDFVDGGCIGLRPAKDGADGEDEDR